MRLPTGSRQAVCELGGLLLVAGLAYWLFELHDIDLVVTGLFYDPTDTRTGGWPWAAIPWVSFVNNHLITIIVITSAVSGALLWALGGRLGGQWRFAGMFIVLSLALGPGLVVNGVLKSVWGRPIPRNVIQFGGTHTFRHISNPGRAGPPERGGDGRSFPSGHASVAFWTSACYFLLRRKRPRWAAAALGGTLVFGVIVGIARISAGRHFISDVVWSCIVVFGVNWLLYQTLLLEPWAAGWPAARRVLARLALTRPEQAP